MHYIKNTSKLIRFSNHVNSGTSYSVESLCSLMLTFTFLVVLHNTLNPLETGDNKLFFQGTFDGHEHTIRNIAVNSSLQYVGLFGYSREATIRNVVLDSSCSVVSSYSGPSNTYAHVRGITRRCVYR